ncbi:B3 domain-containing protein Os01g0234100-like isoform X2 [Gastrolobium bilobum]|uniref:B3 domain-containing protein Os01g0234100-like isoform X2 n=1 Tax=Gastrolobium bilobum TaxID=150636 RepID=UPI002AAF18A7|nr:B3 domain-containing protein Os01g0234100-like isoform X2 [Gastrolobium bilobum]
MAVVKKPSDRDRPSKGKRVTLPKAKFFRKKTLELNPADPLKQTISRNPQRRPKRGSVDSVCNTSEAQFTAYLRAKEVQANLSPEYPSLLKCMLRSHVTGGFWLGLPKKFCQLHLPKADTIIALEDENGELYETKYLAQKVGLSGGWRGFSLAHNLLEMDVLIFHLVQPSKFKVYIIRSQGSDEMDGALGLLKLDDCRKEKDEVDGALDATQGNDSNNSGMIFGAHVSQSDQLENTSKDFCSQVWDGIRFSESVISFEEVTGSEKFSIVVNGLVIDSELSMYLRTKYYELCCSQRSFLHDHLLGGLNSKLVAGIISETINIADAIKATKLTTSPESFLTWDKTLKAFEAMGMNVSFLLIRLHQLMKLALKSERYKESRLERDHAKVDLKALEEKLVQVKQTINRLDEEIGIQDMNPESLETTFQKLASAPW